MKTAAVAAQAKAETQLQLRRGENLGVTLAIPPGVAVFFAKVHAVNSTFADPGGFLVPGRRFPSVMGCGLDKLPAGGEAFAKLLAAAALSETVRGVLTPEAFPMGELVVLVVWAIAMPLLAARYFRWEE